ncbi:MAG: hypothetical protein ABIK99_07430 [candidate division WOR-3 bacterium]
MFINYDVFNRNEIFNFFKIDVRRLGKEGKRRRLSGLDKRGVVGGRKEVLEKRGEKGGEGWEKKLGRKLGKRGGEKLRKRLGEGLFFSTP